MEPRLPFRFSVYPAIMPPAYVTVLLTAIAVAGRGNALPQRVLEDALGLLPAGAVLLKQMQVDFENKGAPEAVLLYQLSDRTNANRGEIGIKVAKHVGPGWELAFEEPVTPLGPGSDVVRIEKLKSANGAEGVLVINYHSGAGTVTAWHVLASQKNEITLVDPEALRKTVLNEKKYADNGYNSVKAASDLVIERIAGYSLHRARCCPNRPSLNMIFKFTGRSIEIASVEELPYGEDVPNLGPHGPLLRINVDEFWSYGFELPDGFLVLAGSEGPISHSDHLDSTAAKIRKSLLEKGALFDADSYVTLTQNQKFPSMAVAAEVMMGSFSSRLVWKDEHGKLIR